MSMADTFLARRVTRSAAELAYCMVMALFPAIICMYDLLALILRDPTAVLRIVETLVLPRETQTLVSEFLTYVSGNTSEVMFFAALLVMITSASAAFRAMAAIVGEIHGAKRFGIVRSTIVSVIFSVAFLLVLYLCILLMLTGKHFLLWLDALLPQHRLVVDVAAVFDPVCHPADDDPHPLPAHNAAPAAAPGAPGGGVFRRGDRVHEYPAVVADRQQYKIFTCVWISRLGRDPAVLVPGVRIAAHFGRGA